MFNIFKKRIAEEPAYNDIKNSDYADYIPEIAAIKSAFLRMARLHKMPVAIYGIHDIEICEEDNNIVIKIYSCNMKSLIGVNGGMVKRLVKEFSPLFDRKIKIDIKNTDFWSV